MTSLDYNVRPISVMKMRLYIFPLELSAGKLVSSLMPGCLLSRCSLSQDLTILIHTYIISLEHSARPISVMMMLKCIFSLEPSST